jgi:hypothetical protein
LISLREPVLVKIYMRAKRLQASLDNLSEAMREVENALAELRAAHDPRALHIFHAGLFTPLFPVVIAAARKEQGLA